MADDQKDYQDYLDYQAYLKSGNQPSPTAQPSAAPAGDSIMSRLQDPDRLRAILTGTGPKAPSVIAGSPPLAIPLGMAPAALAGLAGYLGGSGLGASAARVGAGAAMGGATGAIGSPDDRLGGAEKGAALGGGLGALGEGVGGLASLAKWAGRGLSRMTAPQGEAYLQNPGATKEMARALEDPSKMPALQDQAVGAINNSRKALKQQGLGNAAKLRTLLEGKHVEINPQELSGLNPQVDTALEPFSRTEGGWSSGVGGAGETTSTSNAVSVPANDANNMKRAFQSDANYVPGTVTDPVQAARQQVSGQKAAQLRSGIEKVEPEAAGLNQQMQEGLMLQQALRKGAKNSPLAFVSSESPDRVATLARAENAGAGGLLDFGNKLGAAKTMTRPDQGSGVPTFLNKMLGRGIMRGSSAVQDASDVSPFVTQELIKGLFNQQK